MSRIKFCVAAYLLPTYRECSRHRIEKLIAFSLLASASIVHAQSGASSEAGAETALPAITVTGASGGVGSAHYAPGNTDIIRTELDAQPYTIIDRKAIENSGATTVDELLRHTLSMSTSAANETASGWTGSSSQINLRGLGTSHTLVLINGRRGAGVGSRGTSEVSDQQNINNIPLAAIERIEVLPISASAIYGASAIGGVINVILRRDYVGAEVNVRYGNTFDSDAGVKTINVTSGFSLEEGRTHVLVSAQQQRQNALLWKDRKFAERGRARILERDPASIYNNTASGSPPSGDLVNIRSADGVTQLSIGGVPLGSTYTHIPKGYQGAAIDGAQPLIDNGGSYALGLSNGIGGFSGLSNYVGQSTSDAVTLSVNRDFTKTFNVFLDASYDYNQTRSAGSYHGFGVVTIPAGAASNPFDQAVKVAFPVNYEDGIGLKNRVATVRASHVALGFTWEITPKWTLSADHSYSETRNDIKYQRRPGSSTSGCAPVGGVRDCLTLALRDGTVDVFRDVTSYTTDISPYWTEAPNFTEQKLHDTNIRSASTLASWYAGDIHLATGLGYRQFWSEGIAEYSIMSNPNAATTIREQNASSFYAELTVPFISPAMNLPWARLLEVQIAGRHERFDNTTVKTRFNATMPTVGFRFAPNRFVMLRGSYSKGFVTPTVSQLTPPTLSAGTTDVDDPKTGNADVPVYTVSGGNPDIEPETSKSSNIGIVLTPLPNLRLSIDYFKIRKNNNITSLGAQDILDNEALFGDRVTRNSAGNVIQIDTTPFNALWLETRGVDTNLNFYTDRSFGELTLNLGYTYTDKYKQQTSFGAAPVSYLDLPSSSGPLRHRFNASAFLKINRQWSVGWGMQYYSAYRLSNNPSQSVLRQQGGNKVDAQAYHDVFARFTLPNKLLGERMGTELTLGIKNLFNESARDMSQSNYLSMYSDARLRQYYVNLKASF